MQPAALRLEHVDAQSVHLERLALLRHAAEAGQDVAGHRLEALRLDGHVEPLPQVVDADPAGEDEAAGAFIHDRIRLHVVLVPDLADDLLDQVLDRDQAGPSPRTRRARWRSAPAPAAAP